MADDTQDKSEKTEEPTHRRLSEAMKKGQVPNSREVSNFMALFTFTIILLWVVPFAMEKIGMNFSQYLRAPHEIEVSDESAKVIYTEILMNYISVMIPIIVATVAAAFLGSLIQHEPIFTFEQMMPKLDKISPLAGLKRMFSLRSVTEFLKGLIKIGLVGAIVYAVVWPMKEEFDFIPSFAIPAIMELLHSTALKILMGVVAFMAVIAIIDYIYQKHEYTKELRMSRQDIKEEQKQTEGDPHVKAKLKQIRAERSRKRMMSSVPDADVVVTNPTHFSVALKYDQKIMAAPLVVAKGLDRIALKIREVAEENEIPIVEDPPLARALYDAVDVDEEIPIEYYQAVAEVIGYVYRLKNKKAA